MKKIIATLSLLVVLSGCGVAKIDEKTEDTKTTEEVAKTDYYTLQVVKTTLSPREWLDAEYKDYSGKWAWDFKPMSFGYGDSEIYKGFLAYRDEVGMYVEYRLVPLNGNLFVFRREGKMPDIKTWEGRQEEHPHTAELVRKLQNYKAD